MLPALENRSLDVAMLTEPGATVAIERGIGAKWRISSDWAPRFQQTYLLYGPAFRTAQADLARRWMIAYLKGARWYGRATADPAQQDELFAILAANTILKDVALMRRITFTTMPPNGEILTEDILAQGRWAAQRGYISAVPPLEQMVEPRFVQEAVAELGRM
jgi:NitT/TauT family transport system substrate-binding protein